MPVDDPFLAMDSRATLNLMKAWAGWVTLGARGFGEGGCIGAAEAGDVEAGEEVMPTKKAAPGRRAARKGSGRREGSARAELVGGRRTKAPQALVDRGVFGTSRPSNG